jgi:hypothetical protein
MATLTQAERDQVQWAIDYMLAAGVEKPLDATVIQVLLPMAEKFGFPTEQAPMTGLQEALQDRPFSTLLTALLAVAA